MAEMFLFQQCDGPADAKRGPQMTPKLPKRNAIMRIAPLSMVCALVTCAINAPAIGATPAIEQGTRVTAEAQEQRNRSVARAFLEALYSRDNARASGYLAKDYKEHQISAGFSAEGLLRFARQRATANPDHYLVIHRTIAQGDMVFLHVEERLTSSRSVARGEMFRFAPDGRIAEHWSTQQDAVNGDKNNNGLFLGSELNRASTAGRRYGVAIMENDATLFRTLNPDLIQKTRTSRYLQHNQGVANGPEGLKGFINYMRSANMTVKVSVKNIVAEGDYVVALNYFKTTPAAPGFGEVIVFDIVRITDDGKVDEHWDIIEEVQSAQVDRAF